MTLTQAVEFFLIDQQLRGNTEKTVAGYRGYMSRFLAWLEKKGISTLIDLTTGHINEYQIYLITKKAECGKNERITLRTVRTYMRHIRCFLAFCYTEGFIKEALHSRIKLPKVERPIIEILTEDELTSIFSCFGKHELDLRNIAIIMLMLDCGLRLAEVAGIKHEDINFTKAYITVVGKGRKGRIIPLGVKVRRGLLSYIHKRRRADAARDDEYLFLNRKREPITAAGIVLMIRRIKKEAGIPRLHAHLFRHTFATNFLVYGLGDVYELSRLLGHSELKTTDGYLQLASYYTIMEKRGRSTFLDLRR
jgi:integrase/recombinase XerC/integrase/recombinase XerD